MTSRVAVAVLGVVEARRDSVVVPIAGRKLQALLALLALSPSRPVSDGHLLDEVWSDSALVNPNNSLQAQVSHLRRLLGRDAVQRHGDGYLLSIEPGDVDAVRFERLVDRGRLLAADGDPRNAAQAFQGALSMVRGPPLGELVDYRFAQQAIPRFDELLLAAHEGFADAELACGRHAGQVTSLSELVVRYPLRERFHAQLMRALYRCGRQADALQAYRRARHVLVDELGIEPGSELRELELAVLAQDPSLDAPSSGADARAWPASTAVSGATDGPTDLGSSFVGRDHELAGLTHDLDDALAGHGRIVLLGGEPGIGKSRLAQEVATIARSRDALVVWGRCYNGRGAPSLWPWAQTVQALLARGDADAVVAALGRRTAEIAQLVPEVHDLVRDVGRLAPIEPDGERFRLFDALGSFFCRLAAGRPLVIVLDDLQWADPSTLHMLAFLGTTMLEARLLIVGTYRDVGGATGPLAETFAELARQPLVRDVEVRGLDRDAVASMIAVAGNEASDEVVANVHRRTQGNPFFLVEILRLHAGAATLGERAVVPHGVRDVVRERVRALPTTTTDVLDAAAVIGAEFDGQLLAAMLERPPADVLHELEPAFTARIVVSDGERRGKYRFSHGLVRETLYERLGVAARATLHCRAGTALEIIHGTSDGPHLMRLAEHWSLAVPAATPGPGIAYALRAARWAQRHVAHDRAEEHLRAALALIDAMPTGRRRDELELEVQDELSVVLIVDGGYGSSGLDRACTRMRELCRTIDDPDLLVRVLWRLGLMRMVADDLVAAEEIGEQLLATGDRRVDDGRLLAGHMLLGPVHTYRGNLGRARHHFDVAADLCATVAVDRVAAFVPEHPAVWVAAMSAWNWSLIGDRERSEEQLGEAAQIAASIAEDRNSYPVALVIWMGAVVATMRRDVDVVRERSEAGIAHIMESGYGTVFLPHLTGNLLWVDAVSGDPGARPAHIDALSTAVTSSGAKSWQHASMAFLADALHVNGRHLEALATAEAGLTQVDPSGAQWFLGELHWLRGESLAATGRMAAAIDAIEQAREVARVQGGRGLEQRADASLAALLAPA